MSGAKRQRIHLDERNKNRVSNSSSPLNQTSSSEVPPKKCKITSLTKNAKKLTDEEFRNMLEDSDIEWGDSDSDDWAIQSDQSNEELDDEIWLEEEMELEEDIELEEVLELGGGEEESAVVSTKVRTPSVWLNTKPESTFPHFEFTGEPGIKCERKPEKPIEFFRLIANKNLVDLVVNETNIYAKSLIKKKKEESKSTKKRIKDWNDLTTAEFSKFLGLLFLTGHIITPDIPRLWKKNKLYDFPTFNSVMSRDRFLQILRALHFGRNFEDGGCDSHPLYKIKPLIDVFERNMADIHYPKRELSLDESMILWKGQRHFRPYPTSKRHKHGLKMYMLAQPDGLACKIYVHTGSRDPEMGGEGHTDKIVKKLFADYLGKGHALYMNNLFNSVSLTKFMLQNKTYVTGTLKLNRRGNPKEVCGKLIEIKKNQIVEQYSEEGICVFRWNEEEELVMISSEHESTFQEITTRRGLAVKKPKAFIQYKMFMGGIDKSDQMMMYYPASRNVMRWPTKLGIHIFQLMINNSYLLHKAENRNKDGFLKHLDFRENVIEELLSGKLLTIESEEKPEISKKELNRSAYNVHMLIKVPKSKRKRCRQCYRNGKRKDTSVVCDSCEGNPGFCIGAKCKLRWNNIRDNYKKALKKNLTQSRLDGKKCKHYRYANQLSFLSRYFNDKDTEINANDDRDSVDHEITKEDLQLEPEVLLNDTIEEDNEESESTFQDNHSLTIRKKPELVSSTFIKKYILENNGEENFTKVPKRLNHPVDAFLFGISPMLKSLPPYLLSLAKSEIFTTAHKYEMKMLTESQDSSSNIPSQIVFQPQERVTEDDSMDSHLSSMSNHTNKAQ